mgnify:CR=1 FL=1|jgi:hypothetical protein
MKRVVVLLFILGAIVIDVNAQCSMCSAVVESSQKNGSDLAEGLNSGILYLMGIPYLLLIGTGIVLFRRIRQKEKANA